MSWMIREDKLDPDQKDFINNEINKNGNIWIQGYAGSGKSVMLIHALRSKLEKNRNLKMCIVVFTHSLIDLFRTGINELGINENIPVMTYLQFRKTNGTYDYIFCDEVQDLPSSALQNMKERSKHVLVAGDSNQSIYDCDPQTRESVVTVDEVGSILDARPFVLTRIYRLTRSIINAVSSLIPSLNIFGSKRDMTKQDVSIRLCEGINKNEEVQYIWKQASAATSVKEIAVVLLPTLNSIIEFSNILLSENGKQVWNVVNNQWGKPDWRNLNEHFRKNGINTEFIGSGTGSFQHADDNGNMIIMTYHSAKGMDFDNVFLPFLSSDIYISSRTLFMVGMTRSKKNLYLTYSGYEHVYVEDIRNNCTEINISDFLNDVSEELDSVDFDF